MTTALKLPGLPLGSLPFNSAGTSPGALVWGDINGDGTFQAQARHAAGNQPVDLVTGDFDYNRRLDLTVANPLSPDIPAGTIDYSRPGDVSVLGNGERTRRIL